MLFSAADVVADLDGTGLTARRAGAVQRTATTDDGKRTAIDALIRAERVA